MQKSIAVCLLAAMLVTTFGPAVSLAQTSTATTGLQQAPSGGNTAAAPNVQVKWEMFGPYATTLAGAETAVLDDNLTADYAQFAAPGTYNSYKNFSVCAVVTDPDGAANMDDIASYVYYPTNIYTGANHPVDRLGCGTQVGAKCEMTKLTSEQSVDLFCNRLKDHNANLPTFYEGFSYDSLCDANGGLKKGTDFVYCCDHSLYYEDPASNDYLVKVVAHDIQQHFDIAQNAFTYISTPAVEVDFNQLNYAYDGTGDTLTGVLTQSWKTVNGDSAWDKAATSPFWVGTNNTGRNQATIRNVGNERAAIGITQDDMGFGKTGTTWNIRYNARIGNTGAWYTTTPGYYEPNQSVTLARALDLSDKDEMDFSVWVKEYPVQYIGDLAHQYIGNMWLSAGVAAPLACTGTNIISQR